MLLIRNNQNYKNTLLRRKNTDTTRGGKKNPDSLARLFFIMTIALRNMRISTSLCGNKNHHNQAQHHEPQPDPHTSNGQDQAGMGVPPDGRQLGKLEEKEMGEDRKRTQTACMLIICYTTRKRYK